MTKCKICNKDFNSLKAIQIHLKKAHSSICMEEYFLENIGEAKKCRMCGNKGRFISLEKGFRDLCLDKECIKNSSKVNTISFWLSKGLTEEEAKGKLNELNNKQLKSRMVTFEENVSSDPLWNKKRSRNSKHFWMLKGFSEEEAILKSKEVVKEIQQKSLNNRKESPELYKHVFNTKIEYYEKKGYSKEESKDLLKKRQTTFSLEICIKKYGDDIGNKVWIERQEKWQESLSKNGNIKGGYSKISQELFDTLSSKYSLEESINLFYWTKNKELLLKDNDRIYLYDFTDDSSKKMIEYNGDQYHANPSIYKENDYPHPYNKKNGFSSKEIWEKDEKKRLLAEKNGYEFLVIWVSEYRKKPNEVLDKCLNFLGKK